MNFLADSGSGNIVVGILTTCFLALGAYYLARLLKGKIVITLSKKGYNSGEELSGSIAVKSRKHLEAKRIYIALIGYEIQERRNRDGDRDRHRKEVYRYEQNLAESLVMPAGSEHKFDFSITAPGNQGKKHPNLPEALSGTITTGISVLNSLGLLNTRRLEWKLEARADLPGVDLAKATKVRINLV